MGMGILALDYLEPGQIIKTVSRSALSPQPFLVVVLSYTLPPAPPPQQRDPRPTPTLLLPNIYNRYKIKMESYFVNQLPLPK